MTDEISSFDALYRETPEYYGAPSDGLVACITKYALPPCRAVDVGCGQGRNALWLARNGFDVLALDSSPEAIESTAITAAHERLVVTARISDIAEESLPLATFGLIVIQSTLNHIETARLRQVSESVTNALTPGGLLYCVSFTTADPGYTSKSGQASECSSLVTHYFAPGELRELFLNLEPLEYSEYQKLDSSHGPPHFHGKAKLIARRIP